MLACAIVAAACRKAPPAPWSDIVPRERLVEVFAGTNERGFAAAYDLSPGGVVDGFRAALPRGGFELCGGAVLRNEPKPERASSYFKKGAELWRVEAVATSDRTVVHLDPDKGLHAEERLAAACRDGASAVADASSPEGIGATDPDVASAASSTPTGIDAAAIASAAHAPDSSSPRGAPVLSDTDFRATVARRSSRIRFCYENALRTNPGLAGRVTVRVAIAPDGSVTAAQDAGSTLPSPSVISCVTKELQATRFLAVPGSVGTTKTYSISFKP